MPQIPHAVIHQIEANNLYKLHTLDGYALGGRAIDIQRVNPISGRPMTGSSSGTAINVLIGINDLGIGTDGGGSVLAPAMAVNLFGFISPLICADHLKQFTKKSTDSITFTPSIGYITRSFGEIKDAIETTLELPKLSSDTMKIGVANGLTKEYSGLLEKHQLTPLESPNLLGPRESLITFLTQYLPNNDLIISEEGPIDFYGLGDSILGHFDEHTKKEQEKGNKGLIRVANMVNATAMTIPKKEFASGIVLICESKPEKISRMLEVAEYLVAPEDEMIKRYFRNMDNYFPKGYL